jgi:hypothetical protein
MPVDVDAEIKSFLTFWAEHGDETLRVADGLLHSPGCDGAPGGCCSRTFDLESLAAALRALAGGE